MLYPSQLLTVSLPAVLLSWCRLQEGGLLQSSSASLLTDVPGGIGGSVSSTSMTALATQNSSTGATRTLSAAQSRYVL